MQTENTWVSYDSAPSFSPVLEPDSTINEA